MMRNRKKIIDWIESWSDDILVKDQYGIEFFNIPLAFDIETTSFYSGSEKRACMYSWQFGLNFLPILGRTWGGFIEFLDFLITELGVHYKRRLVVYVQNLGFEFQFMRKYFRWKKVFAMKARNPIYAITDTGIEFRCSYYLSGLSLKKIGENLLHYHVQKMSGDLDYNLMRHSETPLTEKEVGYCINDILVLNAFIAECIEQDGSVVKIPTTKTGYVRRGFRNACYHSEEVLPGRRNYYRLRFSDFINGLTLEPDEYQQLKRVFQGGFTHSNPFITGDTLVDVTSFDITSSYPTVMCAERFPMSKRESIPDSALTLKDFFTNLELYCCMFDCEFVNIRPRFVYDYYISSSKCAVLEDPIVSNGRIVAAARLVTSLTEEDFDIVQKCYMWDAFRPYNFSRYRRGYLPRDFVIYLLKLYGDKTSLKGVPEKEAEYTKSKNQINSAYGMCVTDIVRDEYSYMDDIWEEPKKPNLESAIDKYNKDKNRFLYYPWGVWVTAYARHNLWEAILECGFDYCYSDTDSVKIKNVDAHMDFFTKYNYAISLKLKAACNFHKIDFSLTHPKTINGIEKPLGVYDFDGHYKRFKTLGAKRYLVEYDDGHRALTVAGLGKAAALEYMEDFSEQSEKDIFEVFNKSLVIPKGHTGGSTISYIDEPFSEVLVDYLGNTAPVHELSAIHMEPDGYTMSVSQAFINYIEFLKGGGTVGE